MTRTARTLALVAVGAVALAATGCSLLLFGAGAAAGVGTVAYLQGELRASVEAPFDKTLQATDLALKDMEFAVTERKQEGDKTKLTVRASGDKRIEIQVGKVSNAISEIRIRVGVFGDEGLSRLIFEKIEQHL